MSKSTGARPKYTLAQFDALGEREKIVAVAEDVLMQLKFNRIVPKGGFFFISATARRTEINRRVLTSTTPPSCAVCGLGGCFVSLVRLSNKVDLYESTISFDQLAPKLQEVFSRDMLILIELAFERGAGHFLIEEEWASPDRCVQSTDERTAAVEFGQLYDDERERMQAIMENIIQNNGYFIP